MILTQSPVSETLGPDPVQPNVRAFVHALRALGYEEGRNLVIERRSAEGKFERFGEIAAKLVGLKVDVILSAGLDELIQELKRATSTLPIVMAASFNPVETGLVASLARPGGNVTGMTHHAGPEIEAKRLQMLKEAVPEATRVAFLGPNTTWAGGEGQGVRAAAQKLGVTLILAEYTPTSFADAFAQISREQPQALFVARHPAAFINRQLIAEFAAARRLPGMYPFRQMAEAGGLIAYGANTTDLWRRAAGHVDKILKGTKPADIPVEQPTKFELVINGKTAKALGITMPPTLLTLADEVIE